MGRQECPPHLQTRSFNGSAGLLRQAQHWQRRHCSYLSPTPEPIPELAVPEPVEGSKGRRRVAMMLRKLDERSSSASIGMEQLHFFRLSIIPLTLLSGLVTSKGKQVNDNASSNLNSSALSNFPDFG